MLYKSNVCEFHTTVILVSSFISVKHSIL